MDVLRVVSAVVDVDKVVLVSECVSTTNVEGRSVSVVIDVLDVFLVPGVLDGAGNETGPPLEGGSTSVAVMMS